MTYHSHNVSPAVTVTHICDNLMQEETDSLGGKFCIIEILF